MTPLTTEEVLELLLDDLDQDRSSDLATLLPRYWRLESSFSQGSAVMLYLRVRRRALDHIIMRLAEEHDASEQGVSEQFSQVFAHYQELRKQVDEDIKEVTQ